MNQKNEYPYQNLSLQDMDGEIWRGVAGLEEYYEISNKGRLKSLPRYFERLMGENGYIRYETPEIIRKQTVRKRYNTFLKAYTYSLGAPSSVNKVKKHLCTAREVYRAFVGDIPADMTVLHKDNNPFNNVPDNLYLATRKELSHKNIREKRHNPAVAFASYHWTPERLQQRTQKLTNRVKVSQYDLQGNYIATYNAIAEAAQASGVSHGCISNCLKQKRYSAGKYIWLAGDRQEQLHVKREGKTLRLLPVTEAKTVKKPHYFHDNRTLKNLKGEVWKVIAGTQDCYEVSNKGRVKSRPRKIVEKNGKAYLRPPQIMALQKKRRGHKNDPQAPYALLCTLYFNSKKHNFLVSHLVYQAFIGALPKRQPVFHKDGDSFNNCVDNLYLPVKLKPKTPKLSFSDKQKQTGSDFASLYIAN